MSTFEVQSSGSNYIEGKEETDSAAMQRSRVRTIWDQLRAESVRETLQVSVLGDGAGGGVNSHDYRQYRKKKKSGVREWAGGDEFRFDEWIR